MVGVYFSGTGNTKHCLNEFLKTLDKKAGSYSIEDKEALKAISENEIVILAYPIYYSNLPKIFRDFINDNKLIFKDKRIFCIATMGLFSGDGAGCAARLLRKYGAEILGGLHLKMPDCIADVKLLKKTFSKNCEIIEEANTKIKQAAIKFNQGHYSKEGLNCFYHFAGLFGQRLWFKGETKEYSSKLKVNSEKCIGCGRCVDLCPMRNLVIEGNACKSLDKCSLCYRCVSICPEQAITLLGKVVHQQWNFASYEEVFKNKK